MASYEHYFNYWMGQAQKNAQEYAEKRRQQAELEAQKVRKEYDEAERAMVEQGRLAVAQTDADYREVYDANAVTEAVARRNAAEAMANSQLTNSGLNATQQTAISLVRSRSDSDTTLKKQAAIDSIMRALDARRDEYRKQAAAETSAIYKQAEDAIVAFETEQTDKAEKRAWQLYETDLEEEQRAADAALKELEEKLALAEAAAASKSEKNKDGDDRADDNRASDDDKRDTDKRDDNNSETVPNKASIERNAADLKRQKGDLAAATYLRQCVREGWITAQERGDIMYANGIRETTLYTAGQVRAMVQRMLQKGNVSDARVYIDTLINQGLIDPEEIRDVIHSVM